MDTINWTQIWVGCVFGLIVGVLVYGTGRFLDWREQRRWNRELSAPATESEDRCYGCGEPLDNGQAHGLNQGYGGCI